MHVPSKHRGMLLEVRKAHEQKTTQSWTFLISSPFEKKEKEKKKV